MHKLKSGRCFEEAQGDLGAYQSCIGRLFGVETHGFSKILLPFQRGAPWNLCQVKINPRGKQNI